MKNPLPAAAWLILLLALLLRVGYMAATPDYKLVHDALDYDHAATSIARGDGWPYSRARGAGRRSARPPTPSCWRASTRSRGSSARRADRVVAARILGIVIGMLIVGLIGLVAAAAVGAAGRAAGDGRRGGLHPADPRRRQP